MADLVVSIRLKASDDTARGLKSAERGIGKINTQARRMTKAFRGTTSIDRAGQRLNRFGSLAASAIRAPTEDAVNFNRRIAEISTLTDDASLSQEKLRELVRGANAEFGGGADKQAQALYDIISAGATNASDAQSQLLAANKLAIAGVADQNQAVLALSKTVANFGVSADVAADQLFATVQGGQLTLAQLVPAIGKVAASADGAGISLSDTTAALAEMSKRSGNVNVASTQLSAAIGNIIKPSKQAQKEARRLGLDFNQAALESKGLVGFLADVQKATGGSTESLARLFGSKRALVGVQQLAGDLDGLQKAVDRQASSQGVANKAFEAQNKTAARQIEIRQAQLENLRIELGELLVPALLEAAKATSDVLRPVAQWVKENKPLASGLLKTVAATALLAKGVGGTLRTISVIRDAADAVRVGGGTVARGLGRMTNALADSADGLRTNTGEINKLATASTALSLVGIGAIAFQIGQWADETLGLSDAISKAADAFVRGRDKIEQRGAGSEFVQGGTRAALLQSAQRSGFSTVAEFAEARRGEIERGLSFSDLQSAAREGIDLQTLTGRQLRREGFRIGAGGAVAETQTVSAAQNELRGNVDVNIKVTRDGAQVQSVEAAGLGGDVNLDQGPGVAA